MNDFLSIVQAWHIPFVLIGAALCLFFFAAGGARLLSGAAREESAPISRSMRSSLFVVATVLLVAGLVTALVPPSPPPSSATANSAATPPEATVPPTATTTTASSTPPQGRTSQVVVVNANQDLPGVDTGIDVAEGAHLSMQAQGWASYGYQGGSCVGYPVTNPDGQRKVNDTSCEPLFDQRAASASAPIGELLAIIEPSGSTPDASSRWFAVGSTSSTPVSSGGRVYLLYNDVPGGYATNSGNYQVTITVTAS